MRHPLLFAACALFVACQAGPQSETQTAEAPLGSGEATPPPESPPTPEVPDAPAPEAEPTEATTPFAVHEWGLIRITADGAELATSAYDARPSTPVTPEQIGVPELPALEPARPQRPDMPQRPDRPMQTRKPIVYLHALDGFDPSTPISVTVSIAGGALHEVWPMALGTALGEQFTFGPLTLSPNGCDTSMVPTLDSPFCAMVTAQGGVCETAEMRDYLRPVPTCLETPQGPAPVLLYNGLFTSNVTPVTMTYDLATVSATVTNTSAHPVGPLWAVSLDDNEGTGRHYHRIDLLAPGESRELRWAEATIHEGQHEALIADIRAALLARGLTEAETEDFLSAWQPDVLAPRAPDQINPALPWTAFGFYSDAFIAAQLPMTITPTPAEVHRAIAFSLEL